MHFCGNSKNTVVGAIYVAREACFVFYKSISRGNLVVLPCLHLQFRYKVYKNIREIVGNETISGESELEMEICAICHAKYSPEIHSFILNPDNFHDFPVENPANLHEFVCKSCKRAIKMSEISSICENCSETYCENCVILSFFSSNPANCPGCDSPLPTSSKILSLILKNENLRDCVPREWEAGKVDDGEIGVRRCWKCGESLEMRRYLELGEHVNCWVCRECVGKRLRSGREMCEKYDLPYARDNPQLQIYSDMQETSPTETTPPPIKLTSSHIEEIKSPENALQMKELSVGDPLGVSDTRCQICREAIQEEVKLQDHTCKVCISCLVHYKDYVKCMACDKHFSERDKEIRRELIGEMQKFECFKCKKPTAAQIKHYCKSEKPVCIDCCKDLLISQGTPRNIQCPVCSSSAYHEVGIDITGKNYECSGCRTLMNVLGIAHWCHRKKFFCFECMGLDQSTKEVRCPTCLFSIRNKYTVKPGPDLPLRK